MNESPPVEPSRPDSLAARAPDRRRRVWGAVAVAVGLMAVLAWWEMQASWLQAYGFWRWADALRYELAPGPSTEFHVPVAGPFDERLGYTRIDGFVQRLGPAGYEVAAQVRQSEALRHYIGRGFFPPYHEKTQAGLRLFDCRNDSLFTARVPRRVYAGYDDVPPLIARSLAYIENRELLSVDHPSHNPAVEWGRLGRAVLDQFHAAVDSDHAAAGGSTLATQIEKFRHSPGGRTTSRADKYQQMVSASVRAYLEGEDTRPARREILLDYLNSLPLGALRGFGDVNGVADGLAAWYAADVDAANRRLREPQGQTEGLAERGRALRQMLSLLIAQRRPAFYFGPGQPQLGRTTNSYLRLLGQAGIVEEPLRDAALQAPLEVQSRFQNQGRGGLAFDIDERKAANLTRVQLASLLDVGSLYELDRLDLSATTSIDGAVQARVTALLDDLRKPGVARAAGLLDPQLLQRGDPSKLLYSFALYEQGDGVNRVRVQTDNLDQPFDINSGAKLELGSTAKLRTLVSYLDLIAALHQRYAALDRKALAAVKANRRDRLTRWALDYLMATKDRQLSPMLEAAMQRRYSANPGESFFTGGGVHTFVNFRPEDNGRSPTLYEALRDSVNLVFIRLMRDIVYHHMYRDPSSAASILEDPDHPDREVLLNRFADREGAQFMRGFYRKYRGLDTAQILETLVAGIRPTPTRLAVIFRSLEPTARFEAFLEFADDYLPVTKLREAALRKAFEQAEPGRFSLNDRGYLAHVHPLELLVAEHLRRHPQASVGEVIEASGAQRREVYGWLFRARARSAQDTRILSLLELDAFVEIHRGWQRLGYPFASLVPSYATAIGSSGDRPAALAELMGILLANGQRAGLVNVEDLRLAQDTPYETRLRRRAGRAEAVLAPEVAAVARKALALVVSDGTAKRLKDVFKGADGRPLAIGGKTGTGDNRFISYSRSGAQAASRAVSRTATFVFYLGDRFFGTLTAYVPGRDAEAYRFTSALPTQILRQMAPLLTPIVAAEAGSSCGELGAQSMKLTRDLLRVSDGAGLPRDTVAARP